MSDKIRFLTYSDLYQKPIIVGQNKSLPKSSWEHRARLSD